MTTIVKKYGVILLLIVLVAGCAGPKENPILLENMAPIRSILIVPVINNSTMVNAPDYFLSTITIPIAEQGYYVFPVNMVKRLLEDNGLADANLVHNSSPAQLGELFGADAILYVNINNWTSEYIVLATVTKVDLTYTLKDAHSGKQLWCCNQKLALQSGSNSSGGIVGLLVSAAVEAAAHKIMEESQCLDLARQANTVTFQYPGNGLPPGPYKPDPNKKKNPDASSAKGPTKDQDDTLGG